MVADIERLGRRAAIVQLDLGEADRIAPAIEHPGEKLGGLDAFVGNAGLNHRVPFHDMSLDDWQRILADNLTGAFVATQAEARRMAAHRKGGAIVKGLSQTPGWVANVGRLIPVLRFVKLRKSEAESE